MDDPSSKGIVQMDACGRVLCFVEKPKPGEIEGRLANAGVYVAEASVLRDVPPGSYYDFGQDLVPSLLAKGALVFGRPLGGYLLDIGTPDSYRQAQEDVGRLGRHWEPLELGEQGYNR